MSRLHPPPGLQFNWCQLPSPIDLTLVYLSYRGLTALEIQANATLQRRRFDEIGRLLRSTFGHDSTPTFLSFSGVEWDFKQWGLQGLQPSTSAEVSTCACTCKSVPCARVL